MLHRFTVLFTDKSMYVTSCLNFLSCIIIVKKKNMETRNFRAKVLIRKMSITKLAQIENGDSTPLNHSALTFVNFKSSELVI